MNTHVCVCVQLVKWRKCMNRKQIVTLRRHVIIRRWLSYLSVYICPFSLCHLIAVVRFVCCKNIALSKTQFVWCGGGKIVVASPHCCWSFQLIKLCVFTLMRCTKDVVCHFCECECVCVYVCVQHSTILQRKTNNNGSI